MKMQPGCLRLISLLVTLLPLVTGHDADVAKVEQESTTDMARRGDPSPMSNTSAPPPSIPETPSKAGPDDSPALNGTDYYLECIAKYGVGLSIDSCLDALENIPLSTELLTFGKRNAPDNEVQVPARFLSGKSTSASSLRSNIHWTMFQEV